MSRTLTAAILTVGVAVTTVLAVPATAFAEDDNCNNAKKQVAAGKLSDKTLWAQELLDVKRVWPITKGEGVKVAVLDSGVQADHELLDGRVLEGKAWVKKDKDEPAKGGDTAQEDCDGHGTEVAGVIAGSEAENGFYGIAPEAEILPYRIAPKRPGQDEQATEEDVEGDQEITVTPGDFANAIDEAVSDGADVINMSVKYGQEEPEIAEAVKNAVEADVVVVAAAGNNGEDEDPSPTYPASFPNVLGVGAVDRTLSKISQSQAGPWVDLVAPGAALAAPMPNGKFDEEFGGTSAATAFVSGAAALLKAQHGDDWTGQQIADQLVATASQTPGGEGMMGDTNIEGEPGYSPGYGKGMVNPYRAVTEEMSSPATGTSEMDAPKADAAAVEQHADFDKMRSWALWVGLGSLGVFVAALAGVGSLRRGKKAGWNVKKVDKSSQVEPFDDGDPIPIFQGIKGLKE